jgi:type VI secretion system protein ImpL
MNSFFNSLSHLGNRIPEIILIITILAVVLILVLTFVTNYAIKQAEKKGPKPDPEPKRKDKPIPEYKMPPIGGRISQYLTLRGAFRVGDISITFLRALAFLRNRIDSITYKYHLPWYLMVGAGNSGKSTLLESSGLSLPVGMPDFGNTDPHAACRWWFYNRAVVLDIHGSLVIEEHNTGADEHGWRTVLNLLGRYRAKRPLDGIILTISAAELYGRERLSPENINARAKFLSHKLTSAQHLLGLRLPVYVIITKCDLLPGFQNFCHELPIAQHHNMLGWSVPYALHAAYTPHWIDEAFHSIAEDLANVQLEMFAQGVAEENADGIFVLSDEFSTLKSSLKIYMDHIFKVSAYEESLMLRGLYFCGDSGALPAGILMSDDLTGELTGKEAAPEAEPDFVLSTQPRTVEEENLQLWNENAEAPNRLSRLSRARLYETEESQYIDSTRRHIFFGRDIFEDKIFFESGLAYPVYSRLISANRNLNLAKAGIVAFVGIGTFGMFNAYENFMRNRDFLAPVFGKVHSVLQQISTTQGNETAASEALFNSQAKSLLDMMNHIQRTSFFSFFIPSSWFSPLHDHLNSSLKISYEQIILRTIYMDLLLKARDTLNLRPGDEALGSPVKTTSIVSLLNPISTSEFQQVKGYVELIGKLVQNVDKYNQLRETPDPDILSDLIEYTFNIHLSPEFSYSYEKFRKILQEAPYPPIELKAYYPLAQNTLQGLYMNFLGVLFSPSDPMSLIGQLRYLSAAIGNGRSNQPVNLELIRGFITGLGQSLPNLGAAGHNWIDGTYFDPGPEFTDLMSKIDSLPPFGPAFVEQLAKVTSGVYSAFHDELLQMNTSLINPSQAGKPSLPSEGIFNLEKNLHKLFGEAFMAKTTGEKFLSQIPENKFVLWNQKLIENTINLITQYEAFIDKELNSFPIHLRETFKQIALQNLQMNILNDIARAQTLIDIPKGLQVGDTNEELLRNVIGDMKNTIPAFIKLLETLNKMHNGAVFVELQNLLGTMATRLLERVDDLLISYRPYSVKENNFDWWDGKGPVFLEGFAVKDPDELKSYLDQQRQMISHLAIDYAQPLIKLLESNMMQQFIGKKSLINRWKRIIDQLAAYDKRKPDNTITVLENFVELDINNLSLTNCFEKLNLKSIAKNSGDFFADRRIQLKKALMSRCEIAKRKDSIANYEKLVSVFNESFKDKFPFVGENPSQSQGEVDPEDLKTFFDLYHQFGDSPKHILDQIYQLGEPAKDAYQFIKDMDDVKEFFHTYLKSKQPGDVPTFDFNFDFRVNKDKEIGGNMIIEWTIAPDDTTTISNNDKKHNDRWSYGNPVVVTLRWPDSAETQPFQDDAQPFMKVDEQTVTFTYPGQWALLWLMRTQGATSADFTSMKDTKPYTLRFEIPNGPEEKTVVYNRITLQKPAKGKKPGGPLNVSSFPVEAPGLDKSILDKAEQAVIVQGLVKPDPEIMQDIDERDKKEKKAKKAKKKDDDEAPEEPAPEEKPAKGK